MTMHATSSPLADTIAVARAKIADLKSLAGSSTLAKGILDTIEGLEARLSKCEASFVEAARTAPLPYRKG
jgi:hypothetical protein